MGNSTIGMLLVLASLTVHQFEAMIVKHYGKKYGKGGMFFNAFICLFAMIYFIITDKDGLQFTPQLWVYGLINSTMYATGFYTAYAAYKTGSFGITRLLTSFGVIIPTFYGIVFLKETTTVFTYIALVLILLSLFLMNYQKRDKNTPKENISVKWLVFVVLTILSNAIITIIGRKQIDAFNDMYKNEFLMISLAGATVALFVLGMILERDSFKQTIKHGFLYGAGAGIFNGINNLLILVTYAYLPLSVVSPVKSGLGIVISFVMSLVIYKEKFTRRQLVSACIGIVAVVLMNLKF
ncbi:MAG: EamA family transporter [Clostridia bacterium]|nr:EamA family transporter [Clostridia bacterium]